MGVTAKGYGVPSQGDENVLKLDSSNAQLCEYTENQRIVHFQRANFMVYDYLNKTVIFLRTQ